MDNYTRQYAQQAALELLARVEHEPVTADNVVATAQVWATLALSLTDD